MAEEWDRVRVIECPDPEGKYRVRVAGPGTCQPATLVVERKVSEWEDITWECYSRLSPRKDGGGLYVEVRHGCEVVAIMGMSTAIAKPGYKLEKAPGATFSFRAYKKRK